VRLHLWDDQPVALDTVREVVAASRASFAAQWYGMWLLEDECGFAGTCGLRPTEHGDVQVLHSIEPDRWRTGLAIAAARAVLDQAFDVLGLSRVLGCVDTANHASWRVLEKLGVTPLADRADGPTGMGWLQITRERWRSTSS
jgi:RimJ/RimL family protein N-acetyltransferase